MRTICLFVALFFFSVKNFAQIQQFKTLSFPVVQNGSDLKYPFAGGLNAAQWSKADLNHDGVQDMVVFDRFGDVALTFINVNTTGEASYKYVPQYANYFPPCTDWMLLRDYNNDGAMDIFCASLKIGSQEVSVYTGFYEDNILKFKPFKFTYPGCPTCNRDFIFYPDEDQPGFWNNLPIARNDLPAIDDIDGDGDLDIVTFEASVGGHTWLIQNLSVERGFGLDSLQFRVADKCWGKFYESGLIACKNSLSPSADFCQPQLAGAAEDRDSAHPGSTVMTYDQDNDGDKEVVLGDISFACFNMMTNGGTNTNAWMTAQDDGFPGYDTPVDLANFPAAFYLDVNNDGLKDLIACPNSEGVIEDRKCAWYYKNVGSNSTHIFELQSKGLLVSDMVDIGTASHPAFVDVNGDGLLDMVVGNSGYYTYIDSIAQAHNASLYYFRNIGTSFQPKFELIDTDWLGMSQFGTSIFDLAPAFGDLDNDGDQDLLVGFDGGWLFHYENLAGAGAPMLMQYDNNVAWLSIDPGISSTPVIHDLNGDNLPDLLIGERNGNINYYKNIGTPNEPKYGTAPTIEKLGKIDTRGPNLVGFSTPALVQTMDGLVIAVGSDPGNIKAYKVLGAVTDTFPLISSNWGNTNVGYRTAPAIADSTDRHIVPAVRPVSKRYTATNGAAPVTVDKHGSGSGILSKKKPGNQPTSTSAEDDTAMMELLKKHNKRFAPIPIYEPPRHSVRDVRKWEKSSGKTWLSLKPEEREVVNAEIESMKNAIKNAANR